MLFRSIVDDPRADVVRERLLLADPLEEAAAHPLAEDRVQDRHRPGVRMVAAERGEPEVSVDEQPVAEHGQRHQS